VPPDEPLLNITSCLILAHWPLPIKTYRHPQNRKYIEYRNAVRGDRSHEHRQHAQKFDEFGSVVFSGQTDRHRAVSHHNTWERYRGRSTEANRDSRHCVAQPRQPYDTSTGQSDLMSNFFCHASAAMLQNDLTTLPTQST